MGINGLLPVLSAITRTCNMSEFGGCTAGIDAYAWLHRAAYGCAYNIVMGRKTTKYITFCMRFLNMLRSHNIQPVLHLYSHCM